MTALGAAAVGMIITGAGALSVGVGYLSAAIVVATVSLLQ